MLTDAQLIRDVLNAASNAEGRRIGWLLRRRDALAALDRLERVAEVERAIAERRCNGCGQPAAVWGPVCGGMLQGDWTHYHSPEWWRARIMVRGGPSETGTPR